jgi:hypothetical protein
MTNSNRKIRSDKGCCRGYTEAELNAKYDSKASKPKWPIKNPCDGCPVSRECSRNLLCPDYCQYRQRVIGAKAVLNKVLQMTQQDWYWLRGKDISSSIEVMLKELEEK